MNEATASKRPWLPELRRSLWLAALAVGGVFFITEHNPFLSQAQDFTQDAEAMLETAAGGNMLRRVAFVVMALVGVGLYFSSSAGKIRWTFLGGLMLSMIALAFSSVLWTHDTGLCMRRLFALALTLVGLFGVARNFNLKELCSIALLVSLGCVLTGLGCELALGTFRPWSGEYRFSGTVHPNTQGAYLATLCFAAVCLSVADAPRRYWYWAIVGLGIVLLVLTKSRTSTMGVLATLGLVLMVLNSNRTRLLVFTGGTFAVVAGLLLLLLSGADADALIAKIAFMGRQDETESFSGRTTIWPVVEAYIAKRPLLGYGFESFWTPEVIEDVSEQCQWGVREAHSAYRDMMLNLGIVGLLLYCTIVIVGIVVAAIEYRARGDVCALYWVGMGLNGFFNGMFESGMMFVSFPTFMIAAGLLRLALFHTAPAARPADPAVAWQPRHSPFPAYGIQL